MNCDIYENNEAIGETSFGGHVPREGDLIQIGQECYLVLFVKWFAARYPSQRIGPSIHVRLFEPEEAPCSVCCVYPCDCIPTPKGG